MKKKLYQIFTSLEPISKQIQQSQVTQYKLLSVTQESSKNDILKAIYQQINFIKFPQLGYLSLPKIKQKPIRNHDAPLK
jgi:hypothetical protein